MYTFEDFFKTSMQQSFHSNETFKNKQTYVTNRPALRHYKQVDERKKMLCQRSWHAIPRYKSLRGRWSVVNYCLWTSILVKRNSSSIDVLKSLQLYYLAAMYTRAYIKGILRNMMIQTTVFSTYLILIIFRKNTLLSTNLTSQGHLQKQCSLTK